MSASVPYKKENRKKKQSDWIEFYTVNNILKISLPSPKDLSGDQRLPILRTVEAVLRQLFITVRVSFSINVCPMNNTK